MKHSVQLIGYFSFVALFLTIALARDCINRTARLKLPDNPISEAIKEGRTEDALKLINENKEHLYSHDKHGRLPISEAIKFNNLLVVKALVENGVSPNQIVSLGDTALFDAVVNDDVSLEIVEYLLEAGGNPRLKNHRGVPITEFASGSRLKLLYKYIDKNKNYQYNSAPIISQAKD